MVQGTSIHCVLFVTTAFGLGFDCNGIQTVVHIGVSYSMEKYCQKWAELEEMVYQPWLINNATYMTNLAKTRLM